MNTNKQNSEIINKYNNSDVDEILKTAIEYLVGIYGRSNFTKLIYNVTFDEKPMTSKSDSISSIITLLLLALQKLESNNTNTEYVSESDNLKNEINNIEISLDAIKNIIYNINNKTITITGNTPEYSEPIYA